MGHLTRTEEKQLLLPRRPGRGGALASDGPRSVARPQMRKADGAQSTSRGASA